MKIILSIAEAKAIQKNLNEVQEKVNELEEGPAVEIKSLKDFFSNVKNNMVIKYKLFKGIEVSIDDEFTTDVITLWKNATIMSMPSVKAIFAVVEAFMPINKEINALGKVFTDKYTDRFQTVTDEEIWEPTEEELASRPF